MKRPMRVGIALRVLFLLALLLIESGLALCQNSGQSGSATISGHVTIDGKGAGGIVMLLMKQPVGGGQDEIQQMFTEGLGAGQATTDIDGSYRFTGVQPGRYAVHPFSPGSAPQGGASKTAFAQGTELTVNEGETVAGIDFTLARGGVITGKVVRPDGSPVIGALVYASIDGGSPNEDLMNISRMVTGMRSRMTDDRGIYRIYGLAAGKYTVRVTRSLVPFGGSKTDQSTYYPGVSDAASAGKVDVTPGAETSGVDIKVAPANSSTYRASGRVVDDSGNPVAGVQITCQPATVQGGTLGAGGVPVTTNAAGEFHIQGLNNGSYQASVFSGFDSDAQGFSDPASFEIKNADASSIEIKFHQGGVVSGTVTLDNSSDSEAMAKLGEQQVSGMVFSSGTMGFSRSPIGPDGGFALHGLPPGDVRITIGSPLDMGTANPFKVTRVEQEGNPAPGAITLGPGQHLSGVRVVVAYANCSISGSVTVLGGKLPPGTGLIVTASTATDGDVDVSFSAAGQSFGGDNTAQVDGSGHFRITGLAPGSYEVVVSAGGPGFPNVAKAPTASKTVSVAAGGEEQVELQLDLSSSGQKDKEN